MRSYSSGFFDCRRLATDLCHSTNSPRKRLIDALLLVLTVSAMALEVGYEITGVNVLDFCAKLIDEVFEGLDRRFGPH
jgi:hypothetical protein